MKYGVEAGEWPTGIIVQRLNRIYEDGIVTPEELEDLGDLLQNIIGGMPGTVDSSTTLPLTKPVPEIVFDGNVFVFTGKFAAGTRNHCYKETMIRGGICEDSVTLRVDYLVIGAIGSRDWIHTPYGRKIERAVDLQRAKPISIVSEQTWARYLL